MRVTKAGRTNGTPAAGGPPYRPTIQRGLLENLSAGTRAVPPVPLSAGSKSNLRTRLAIALGGGQGDSYSGAQNPKRKLLLNDFKTWRNAMMRSFFAVAVVLCAASVALGKEIIYNDLKVVDATGKQADAMLVFNDANKAIMVKVVGEEIATIPYDKIDKLSYEYSKKHRVMQGAVIMILSVGAGGVVMLTRSKSHWLYIDYHQERGASTLVLRMDKKDYKNIMDTATAQTGKTVENLGNVKNNKQT